MLRSRCVLALALLLSLHASSRAQEAPWRLALASASSGVAIDNLLDLAQAKLSAEPKLELLERKAIAKLLAEQKLSLSGLVDANAAVKVGKILRADGFALIEADAASKEALGLVIYDTDTGVKWHDQTLPAGKLAEQVEAIAAAVRSVAKKRAAGPKTWQTVCVLGTRNADLPRGQDHVAPTIAWLLERHLLTSPSLAVLERKRLDWVNQEKALTGTQKELLASLVTVEVEISRADKGIRAIAYLSDAKGKDLGKIRAESASASAEELANGLLAGVVRTLQAAPLGTAPDRLRESQRFFHEGRNARTHKLWPPAIQALEAAYALDPDKEPTRVELVNALLISAFWRTGEQHKDIPTTTSVMKQVLSNGMRGYELRLLALEQSPNTLAGLVSFSNNYSATRYRLIDFHLNGVPLAALDAEIHDMRRRVVSAYLRMAREEMSRAAKAVKEGSPKNAIAFNTYVRCYQDFLSESKDVRFFSPQELEAVGFEALERWIEMTQTPGRLVGPKEVNDVFKKPLGQSLKFAPLYETLSKRNDPLAQLWGRYLLLRVRRQHGMIMPAEADAEYEAIKQAALRTIVKYQPPAKGPRVVAEDLRYACYEFLHATTKSWPFRAIEAPYREHFALCEFMLQRNEIVLWVFLPALGNPLDPRIKHTFHRERWDLIEHAQKVLAAGNPALLEDAPYLRQRLAETRQSILREHPDLAGGTNAVPLGPWKQARLLFRADGIAHIRQVALPTVRGDHLFVPICRNQAKGGEDRWVDVVKISWRDETAWKKWAEWKVPPSEPGEKSFAFGEILASCWGNGRYFVATQHGIFAIDEQGAVRHWSKTLALPSSKARSLAFLEGKLFAALEGGYLVALDPNSGQFETLASSRRRELLSPFDNSEEFHIRALHADAERGRLLILLYQRPNVRGAYTSEKFPAKDTTNGLWEYDLKTKKFTRHAELFFDAVLAASTARPGHWLLAHYNNDNVLDFDMKTNQCEVVFGGGLVGPAFPKTVKPRLPRILPYLESYAQHQGYLWGANTFSFARVALKNGRVESFPSFMTALNQRNFIVHADLLSLDTNHLYLQNHTGSWLLEMPGKTDK